MARELIKYTNTQTVKGDSSSQMIFVCDIGEMAEEMAALLNALDLNDYTLVCQRTSAEQVGEMIQPNGEGKIRITADFWPKDKGEASTPDEAFKWRLDWKCESFTLDPQWWKWQENGKIIDAKKSLLKRVSLAGITLYGTRSQIDLSTFDVYEDKVNSDVFLGAQPGHVLFESASAQPKQQQQSRTILREVELHLVKRSEKWEKEFNHKAGSWMTPVVAFGANAGNKLVESVAFAPLLQAP